MKKTKIIATIGPASKDISILVEMIKSGMNIARLNFSHGTFAQHAQLIKNIRSAASKTKIPVAIIQDLSGPKLRLGEFSDKILKENEHVVLGHGGIPVVKPIWQWVAPGQTILIDDGLVELFVTKTYHEHLEAKVIVGGLIKSHKGVSLPGVKIDLPSLSDKDLLDLEFGIKSGVDFIALSFVKTAADIKNLKSKIKKHSKTIQVIAKIETPEALQNIDSIIATADAIMVARGDLALNIKQQSVPVAQKEIVKKCLDAGVPVIVATQMLDSMTNNPRPTRAEISDVANAAIDHVDCVMLSGETAFGKYPVKVIETMRNIVTETENSSWDDYHAHVLKDKKDKKLVLASTLIHMSHHSKVSAIAVSDVRLAFDLSRFRPKHPVFFISKNPSELHRACLFWGVNPLLSKSTALAAIKNSGLFLGSDRIISVSKAGGTAHIESL